jgi:hypothetical protein
MRQDYLLASSFSVLSSVADPRHFGSDPDPAFNLDPDPTFHSYADPGPTFQCDANPYHITHFSQIWTLHCPKDIPPPPPSLPPFHFDVDPNPAIHFDADPNPVFYFDIDPIPVPASQNDPDPQGSKLNSLYILYDYPSVIKI